MPLHEQAACLFVIKGGLASTETLFRLDPLQVLAHEAVASLQQAVQDCQEQYCHFSSGLLRFEVR